MTGALRVADGTVGAPGLAIGANDTGIYGDSSSVKVSIGNSTKLIVNTAVNSQVEFKANKGLTVARAGVASAATIASLDCSGGFANLTGSTQSIIQGIAVSGNISTGGSAKKCTVYDGTGKFFTVSNLNASAASNERIITGTNRDILNVRSATFIYNDNEPRWVMESYNTSLPVYQGGTMFTQLTSVTVANTSSETTALTGTNALGSVTLAANTVDAGRSIYFKAGGVMRCTSTPTATLRFKVGSSNVIAQNLTPGAIDTGGDTESYCDTTAKPFIIDAWCSFRSVGASGSLMCNGGSAQIYANSKTGGISNFGSVSTATIDTTANQVLDFTIQWDAASADNELTIHNAIIEVK